MKTLLLLLCLTVAACSGTASTGPKPTSGGILDAQKDIAAGKLMLFEEPIPAPAWYGDYHQALKDKGIEVKVGSEAQLTTNEKTYNQTMTAEIEKRHGPGIVGKLRQEAQDKHEAKHGKPKE
jgi:hypothetical protein